MTFRSFVFGMAVDSEAFGFPIQRTKEAGEQSETGDGLEQPLASPGSANYSRRRWGWIILCPYQDVRLNTLPTPEETFCIWKTNFNPLSSDMQFIPCLPSSCGCGQFVINIFTILFLLLLLSVLFHLYYFHSTGILVSLI